MSLAIVTQNIYLLLNYLIKEYNITLINWYYAGTRVYYWYYNWICGWVLQDNGS